MKLFPLIIVADLLLFLTNILLAQTPPTDAALTANPVYQRNCAKCHGKNAEGRHFGGPSLISTTASPDELRSIVSKGKGRMPQYAGKLSPDEIDNLIQEIAGVKQEVK